LCGCLLPCERHERFRKIRPFQDPRLNLQRLGKAEMTLKPITIVVAEVPQVGCFPDVYAKAGRPAGSLPRDGRGESARRWRDRVRSPGAAAHPVPPLTSMPLA
jgi:hypothetical protein